MPKLKNIEHLRVNNIVFISINGRCVMVRPHTLQEISDELGLSRERVRQIERQALAKMKVILIEQGYDPDDVFDFRE